MRYLIRLLTVNRKQIKTLVMPSHIQNNFAGNVFASLSFSGLLLWHLFIIPISLSSATYFADWSSIGSIGRDDQPLCVDIPSNMSLCKNIGYTKMRLPNLLDHDTLQEASQQAASWIPLLNVKCHEDTQLFLCSLFAPVSLDNHTIHFVLIVKFPLDNPGLVSFLGSNFHFSISGSSQGFQNNSIPCQPIFSQFGIHF